MALTWLVPPLAKAVLRRRLKLGKEDPDRLSEKLGQPSARRPHGPLIWINAVGLGEILSLRGLIASLTEQHPKAHVLVTSTTRDSAKVFGENRPDRTVHQFLPIDAPQFRKRFLDHWKPDVAIWAEQDIWPGFVVELKKRRIPQAVVASRMDEKAFRSRLRAPKFALAILQRMSLITAQDEQTARHLSELGALNVRTAGSLKPAAPPLSFDKKRLNEASHRLEGRFVWSVISSYPEDERIALDAHGILRQTHPAALLIIAPRQVGRDFEELNEVPRLSKSQYPDAQDCIWLADTIGDIGLILRLSKATLIGGTYNATEGHNPWEAVALGVPSFHGLRTANFKNDFRTLDEAECSALVGTAEELATSLVRNDLGTMADNAQALLQTHKTSIDALAQSLLGLMDD